MLKTDGGVLNCWRRLRESVAPEEEETMQKWFIWKETMKKEDDKRMMGELHRQKVSQMIQSAEGSAGLLHKITVLQERRRGRKAFGPLCSKEERVGKALAMLRKCAEHGGQALEK